MQSVSGSRSDRFRAIFEANYPSILGYALRRTGRDDAGDVVAETFLVAWRRLDDIPEGTARLWLYGAARRVLANHERARRRRERLEERLRAEPVQEAGPVPTGPGANLVAAAFARLPANERELLALAAWEGLDPGEIGAVCGCSRNAARIRLYRARRRFAREFARLGAPPESNSQGRVGPLAKTEEPL